MVNRIHLIDPSVGRRARISRELNTHSLHTEIYEDVQEFLAVDPTDGLVLAVNDPKERQQNLIEIIKTLGFALPIVGYAENPSTLDIVEAILAGARGYLLWPFEDRELAATLTKMAEEGEQRLLRAHILSRARGKVATLSPRERQVLSAIISGLSNKEIGDTLGISPRTVEIHRSKMMLRLRARSSAEAVKIGLYGGLDEDWSAARWDAAA